MTSEKKNDLFGRISEYNIEEPVKRRPPMHWETKEGREVQYRYLSRLFELVHGVRGDVAECGIGEGLTFTMFASIIRSEENPPAARSLWGFDSFEGFPQPSHLDRSPRAVKEGEWKIGEELVREQLRKLGIRESFSELPVHIIKGFFSKTLRNCQIGEIALLHIDCDLYSGYRDALKYLFPKVAIGGVVAFDEYREYPDWPEYKYGRIEKWPGCTRAVDEYFDDRPEPMRYDSQADKFFVVKEA